jgi:hypothetical protein
MVSCARFVARPAAGKIVMWKMSGKRAGLTGALLGAGWALLSAAPASAGPFEFAPAPQNDLNRVYRIDKATGEVGACQFQLKEGGVGLTVCFPSGEGAGPQAPSDYGLMPSRHEKEGGIFRVNIRTGEMSICYVFDDKTVCTPQTK